MEGLFSVRFRIPVSTENVCLMDKKPDQDQLPYMTSRGKTTTVQLRNGRIESLRNGTMEQ